MRNETVWVWIPIAATVALAAVARRTAGGGTRGQDANPHGSSQRARANGARANCKASRLRRPNQAFRERPKPGGARTALGRPRSPETMTSDTVTIVRAELTDAASRDLVDSLNAELTGLYPQPGANHFRLDPDEVTDGRGIFLVVYRAGMAAGCGALRLLDVETAELKRMYVLPHRAWKRSRGGGSWPRSRRRHARSACGDSFSKLVSGRRPPSRSIGQWASSQSRCSGSTASRRRPACASARSF